MLRGFRKDPLAMRRKPSDSVSTDPVAQTHRLCVREPPSQEHSREKLKTEEAEDEDRTVPWRLYQACSGTWPFFSPSWEPWKDFE